MSRYVNDGLRSRDGACWRQVEEAPAEEPAAVVEEPAEA